MKLCFLLIISVFASEENETVKGKSESNVLENNTPNEILVKIEEDEFIKEKKQNCIGVSYHKRDKAWTVARWSKNEKKLVHSGTYKDEEAALYASDTLARNLIADGEKGHKFNFPDSDTEAYREKTSNYFGVSYCKRDSSWRAQRWSKNENKQLYNGTYNDEETAAHASDTLARQLIANGAKGLEINFPDDDTEVNMKNSTRSNKKTSIYYGVSYVERDSAWRAQRWSKYKKFYNGTYKDEKKAAYASDTLARNLTANGEKGHKLNFPDENTEVYPKNQKKKRKRPVDLNKFE